ncbi:MAG: hypothetical protein ABJE95_04960 [Byssovorax sp.]
MAATLPRTAIAAPNFFVFVVAYAGWATVLMMWALRPVINGSDPSLEKALLVYALAPVLILLSSRWVGASPNLATLLRRAVTAHVLSLVLPDVLEGLARSSDPGFSGHGGIVLFLMIALAYGTFAAAIVGLVGAFSAFGAMRLLRKQQ